MAVMVVVLAFEGEGKSVSELGTGYRQAYPKSCPCLLVFMRFDHVAIL